MWQGVKTHGLAERAHRRLRKLKRRLRKLKRKRSNCIPYPILANTGVIQDVFNRLESELRNSKTQKYKIMRKRALASKKRILLTFLPCFLTPT